MLRDIAFGRFFSDVAKGHFAEIRKVGLLCVLVPLGREYTLSALGLHSQTEATHAREEVDESECCRARVGERNVKEVSKEWVFQGAFGHAPSIFLIDFLYVINGFLLL